VRSRLALLVSSATGAARVLSLTRLPAAAQPAFDLRRAGGGGVRSLAAVTSAVVDEVRSAIFRPPLAARETREVNNEPVLRGRTLKVLANPAAPVALIF
jgi:hypothetical protein